MRVIFVNYGLFNSNSGGHIAHFANGLAEAGLEVAVVGAGDPASVREFGPPLFRAIPRPADDHPLADDLAALVSAPDTIVHAWSPRRTIVRLLRRFQEVAPQRYLIHLEDNEWSILARVLDLPIRAVRTMSDEELDARTPENLTHPGEATKLIAGSVGLSVIVPPLAELYPHDRPVHTLEPGVDGALFCDDLSSQEREQLRASLYIPKEATVLVYHGNLHDANWKEVFSLYTAVLILRRRGHNVVLIRTGQDFCGRIDASYAHLQGDWVINLGFVERDYLISILKIADVFVQPGAPDEFNIYRFPSKLPEFLSLGKPTVLPATNVGRRLNDGENALLLHRGDGAEIADRVAELLGDRKRATRIGASGRAFAMRELNWTTNTRNLLSFYQRCLRTHDTSALVVRRA